MLFFDLLKLLEIILLLILHLVFPLILGIDGHKKINFLHIFFVLLHIKYQMLMMIFREPERPVTTTNLSLGISKLISFKLCTFAPFIIILSLFIKLPPYFLIHSKGRLLCALYDNTLYRLFFCILKVFSAFSFFSRIIIIFFIIYYIIFIVFFIILYSIVFF